jgi:hypothetical protein
MLGLRRMLAFIARSQHGICAARPCGTVDRCGHGKWRLRLRSASPSSKHKHQNSKEDSQPFESRFSVKVRSHGVYSILPASRAMCRRQFSIRQHARAAHLVRRGAVRTAVSLASRNNLIVNFSTCGRQSCAGFTISFKGSPVKRGSLKRAFVRSFLPLGGRFVGLRWMHILLLSSLLVTLGVWGHVVVQNSTTKSVASKTTIQSRPTRVLGKPRRTCKAINSRPRDTKKPLRTRELGTGRISSAAHTF